MKYLPILICTLLLSVTIVNADDTLNQESYSVFNPTPAGKMRDFATDRPDKTESAYSLDAGHLMHETDLLNYAYNQDDGVRTDSFFIMAPNAKIGLTNSTDLQIVWQPYTQNRERIIESKKTTTNRGSSDLVVRLKTNMWGNDQGDSAGAIMPYIKIPTAKTGVGNGAVEGGIIIPFAHALGDKTGLGFMTQFDFLRNETDSDYYAQYINSITIGTNLIGNLSAYSEVWTATSSETNTEVTLDFGTTYAINENTQLDMGINIGATAAADDFNPFIGLSQRF
jgi:hypothetical protein